MYGFLFQRRRVSAECIRCVRSVLNVSVFEKEVQTILGLFADLCVCVCVFYAQMICHI